MAGRGALCWSEQVVPGLGPACLSPAPETQGTSPLSMEAHVPFWLGKWVTSWLIFVYTYGRLCAPSRPSWP